MCDPLSMLTLALTAGSTLFGVSKMANPPEPELPGAPAATARTPGATVRIGTGAEELEDKTTESTAGRNVATRSAGTALGGLGKSSLAL